MAAERPRCSACVYAVPSQMHGLICESPEVNNDSVGWLSGGPGMPCRSAREAEVCGIEGAKWEPSMKEQSEQMRSCGSCKWFGSRRAVCAKFNGIGVFDVPVARMRAVGGACYGGREWEKGGD